MLHPFISEANHWMLLHHSLFQTLLRKSRGHRPEWPGRVPGQPVLRTDRRSFAPEYDEVSFDPAYPNEPMETFIPMLRRVLSRKWTPPKSSNTAEARSRQGISCPPFEGIPSPPEQAPHVRDGAQREEEPIVEDESGRDGEAVQGARWEQAPGEPRDGRSGSR